MSSSPLLFSLITVTRNARQHFGLLRDDLRRIGRGNHEWIVVDGASTDGTVDMIKDSADVVTRWVSEPDAGLYDAMNKGLALATGEYVVFFGADDRLYPHALRAMEEWVEAQPTRPDFIVADVELGDSMRRGYRPGWRWLGPGACVSSHSVGMLVRREVMMKLGGFSPRYPQCADGLLIKQLISGPYAGVSAPVVMGRFTLGGISNTHAEQGLKEGYLIQLETGENRVLQWLLYRLRLIKNAPRLRRARE